MVMVITDAEGVFSSNTHWIGFKIFPLRFANYQKGLLSKWPNFQKEYSDTKVTFLDLIMKMTRS